VDSPQLSYGRSAAIASLLRAFVKVDGERLVMHAGDAPYVVTPLERVELSSRSTPDAVRRIVQQLVPSSAFAAFEELGCVLYQFAPFSDRPDQRFTIIATRHDGDVRAEIHRAMPVVYDA
jgi:hypothetical protein